MSAAPPLATIPVGVIVERTQGASASGSTSSGGRSPCSPGEPDDAALDHAQRSTATARPSMPARRRSSCTAPKPRNYRDNLATRRAGSVGGAARDRHRAALRGLLVTADPAEGEAMTEAGNDLVEPVPMPDAIREPACSLRRRAPCRAGVRQAQARPRQSRSAGAAADDKAEGRAMTDPENFLARWSRKKREAEAAPETPKRCERRAGAGAGCRVRPRRKVRHPAVVAGRADAKIRSRQPAIAGIDHSDDRYPRVSHTGRAAGADPCGPSPRLVRRPRHPRFCGIAGKRLGLHRSEWRSRIRRAPAGIRRQETGGANLRRTRQGARGRACKHAAGSAARDAACSNRRRIRAIAAACRHRVILRDRSRPSADRDSRCAGSSGGTIASWSCATR